MFRMSCDESTIEDELEPLPPDICLEQVWQEQATMIRYVLKHSPQSIDDDEVIIHSVVYLV